MAGTVLFSVAVVEAQRLAREWKPKK